MLPKNLTPRTENWYKIYYKINIVNDLQDANKTEGSIYIYFLQLFIPKFYNQKKKKNLSSSESKWPSVLNLPSSVFLLFQSIFFFYLWFSITFFGAWFKFYSRITSCFLNLLWKNLLINWCYLKLIYLMLDFFLLNLYGFYLRLTWISVGYLWLSTH